MNTDQDVIKFFDKLKEYKGIGATAKMIRTPVDIETWINEEYYSGPSSRQIYPYWRNAIIKVFNSPVRINTVVITTAGIELIAVIKRVEIYLSNLFAISIINGNVRL